MTNSELDAILTAAFDAVTQNFSLSFPSIQYEGAQDVIAIASDYFPNNTLSLKAVTRNNQNTNTFSGIGIDYPFKDIPVSVTFYLGGDEADMMEFTLTAQTVPIENKAWTLANGFPAFEDTIYTEIPFVSTGKITLYSTEHILSEAEKQTIIATLPYLADELPDTLEAGLYVNGAINVANITGGLSTLFHVDSQDMLGTFTIKNQGGTLSDLYLEGISPIHLNIGFATLENADVILAYETIEDPEKEENVGIAFMQIASPFSFETHAKTYEIPIYTKVYDTSYIRFEADLTEAIQAGLDAIKQLCMSYDFQNFLPPNMPLDSLVALTAIYVDYDGNNRSISNIGIEISNRTPINIVQIGIASQSLTFDNIILNMAIADPINTPNVSVSVRGEISLGEVASISLSLNLPETIFYGSLKEGTDISLTELMTVLVGSSAGLPALSIDDMEVSFAKKTNSYSFDYQFNITIDGVWWIVPNQLFVESLLLSISSNPNYFYLEGKFSVASILFYLSSEYTGASGEWVFTGGTDENYAPVKVGYLIQQLAYFFNTNADLPAFLTNLDIRNIGVTFNTLTKDFTFHCEINDTFDGISVNMKVDVAITLQNDGSYRKTFGGQLFLDSGTKDMNNEEIVLAFDLVFSTNKDEFVLLAEYNNVNHNPIPIQRLIQSLVGLQDWTNAIPQSLTFTIENALFAWYNPSHTSEGNKGKVLFSIDMGSGINLSNLPLVGKEFGPEQTAELNYQVVISSDNFSYEELMSFNDLLPYDAAKFITSDINSRFFLNTTLQIAGIQQTLPIPVTINTNGQLQNTPGTTLPTQPLWFNIQKALGPVYFSRIGVLYDNELLTFYLDASLQAGALSMAIDGLYVSNPINIIDPTFGIKGLAVDYATGGLAVNAALLHQMTNGFDAYNGTATLKMESFGLSALGSYATDGTHYSLFIYGVLNAPLGGEPFFFVTGLAAGLGYNRDLVIPPLAQLGTFPLVMEAMNESYTAQSLEDELNSLAVYIPPSIGMYWGAAGIKFTSFKIIDAFALLTLSLGERFELNIMGMATALVPPMTTGNLVLAEIQMAMLATFRPSEGMIGVAAQLTDNSFILSREAKLTGGFALYAWFSGEHAGDFVLSAGGYHPKFIVPKHYPLVPRLGLNWKISTELSVKGQLYYALTAGYMMAGGSLEMTWQSGSIKAWFTIGMDIIVAWKPFHYDLNSYVQVGASYTFDHLGIKKTYSLSAGANLHIWGPEFSGTANIDMKIISFTVSFGAARNLPPTPISWTDFTRSFLPENPITSSITKGLTGQSTNQLGNLIHIVDATSLQFAIQSVMPLTSLNINDGYQFIPIAPTTGIAPINIGIGQVQTTLQLNITKNGVAFHDFTSMAIAKKVPNGLWGETFLPKLNDVLFKENVICGYTFFPQTPVLVPETSFSIQESLFSYQVIHPLAEFSYNAEATITTENTNAENLNVALAEAIPALITLMQSMELEDTSPNVTDTWADMFLICPKIQTI